jgi:hypothetical protein
VPEYPSSATMDGRNADMPYIVHEAAMSVIRASQICQSRKAARLHGRKKRSVYTKQSNSGDAFEQDLHIFPLKRIGLSDLVWPSGAFVFDAIDNP